MQNCQTLVPDPMVAPSVCAEGWICFFCNFFARLLRVLNGFVSWSVVLCSFDAMGHGRFLLIKRCLPGATHEHR